MSAQATPLFSTGVSIAVLLPGWFRLTPVECISWSANG